MLKLRRTYTIDPTGVASDNNRNLLVPVGVATVLIAGLSLVPSIPAMAAISLLVCVSAAISPRAGILCWIIAIPIARHLEATHGFSGLILISAGVFLGYVINSIIRGTVSMSRRDILIFYCVLAGVLPSSLRVESNFGSAAVVTTAGLLTVYLSILLATEVRRSQAGVMLIGNGIISGAIIATYIAFSQYAGGASRLAIGGHVRSLANWLGLTLVFVVASMALSSPRTRARSQYLLPLYRSRVSQTALILAGTVALMMSMSRGVFAGVILACGIIILGQGVDRYHGRESPIGSRMLTFFGIAAGLAIVGLAYIPRTSWGVRMTSRLGQDVGAEAIGTRTAIWQAAFTEMEVLDWLIGAGPAMFRRLSLRHGLDYYAHSVFIDWTVSFGAVMVIALGVMIMWIGWRFIRARNVFGLGLLVYTMVSHATHGSAWSASFWLPLGICYGLATLPTAVVKVNPNNLSTVR